VRLLFHGTSRNDPIKVATSEIGLSMRYSKKEGAYGSGIYFTDNVDQSDRNAFYCSE